MEHKKIEIIPYLPFAGNCEEAINTYIEAFGGEIHYMSCWSESMYDVKPEHGKKLVYVEFTLGNVRMAAGDHVKNPETAAGLMLMVHMDSEEEAIHATTILGKDGIVLSPLHRCLKTNSDDCDAVLIDRFGVTWIITCQKSAF